MTFSDYCRENLGYETKTTFWEDFSIADKFGPDAIKDTFNRAFKEWRTNVEYLTELVLVLNHKTWYYYESGDQALSILYTNLYNKADEWACENLKDEDAQYYFRTLD